MHNIAKYVKRVNFCTIHPLSNTKQSANKHNKGMEVFTYAHVLVNKQ